MALEEVVAAGHMECAATDEDFGSTADESATAPVEMRPLSAAAEGPRVAFLEWAAADERGGKKSSTPTKLYVGNLSMKVNGNDLRELFQKYGKVSDVDVVGSFAFVVMPNESEAEEAIKELNDQSIDGKMLIVEKKKARSASARRPDSRGRRGSNRDIQLFVARCKDVPEDTLKEMFAKFGDVVSVQKPRTKPDIAFVSMENFFEARKAIESLNKKPVGGLERTIFVQLSTNNVTRDGRPLQALLEKGETIKLFVGNLDKEKADAKALGVLFERYGPVFDVAVIKDKGFGFVHMLSRESAEDAVRGLNRRDFNGAVLSVTFSVKKGMSIAKPSPGGPSNAGRLGAQTMLPRMMMNRGDAAGPFRASPHADVFADGIVDPLLALQQQINSQYLSSRPSFGPLSASRPGFNLDALMPGFNPYAGAPPRSPIRDSIRDLRFAPDERSRYANFVGAGNSPLKRGRSPVRGVQRLSPSPKRNFNVRFSNSPSRNELSMANADADMRRNAAKSVPPKIFRQRVF